MNPFIILYAVVGLCGDIVEQFSLWRYYSSTGVGVEHRSTTDAVAQVSVSIDDVGQTEGVLTVLVCARIGTQVTYGLLDVIVDDVARRQLESRHRIKASIAQLFVRQRKVGGGGGVDSSSFASREDQG